MTNISEKKCLICGKAISSDSAFIEAILDTNERVIAHKFCVLGMKALLELMGFDNESDSSELLKGVVKKYEDKWILLRRSFPNQKIPILIYFQLHKGNPKSMQDLKDWLRINKMKYSNPSVPVKRLVDGGFLAVLVNENNTDQYFITDDGSRMLTKYLHNKSNGGDPK